MLLRNARLVDGSILDVAIHDDRVAAIGHGLAAGAEETSLDLEGRLLLPAPAEPHTHLDKAFTAERVHNPTGDLIGAISAWQSYRDRLTVDDIAERAEAAARLTSTRTR